MTERPTRREVLRLGLLAGGAAILFGDPGCISRARSAPSPALTPRAATTPTAAASPVSPWREADAIIRATTLPAFPEATFLVTDPEYGAVAEAGRNNTAAFRAAIEACTAQGGGHVVVPAGAYTVGAIRLRSNVDLRLDPGAVLNFSSNIADYPLVFTRYAGIECVNYSPMVYAYGETNIGLTGAGVLDASATGAWNIGTDFTGILEPLVAESIPPEQRVVPHHGRLRSAFIEPYACTNVLISGVTLRRSQFWQLHPTLCRNVWIEKVTTGDTVALNSDGCDPESCDHVVITDCTFDANDDCIAIKSGRDADGRRVNTPSQNIVIRRCELQGPVGGVALGSEMSGGIRNVYVYDVESYGRGLSYMMYVKSNTRRGGFARNVRFDSVGAAHLSGAWAFAQMDYNGQTGGYPPIFEDWRISRCTGDAMPYAFHLSGLAGDAISGVDVTDCTFTNVANARGYFSNVSGLTFENVTVDGQQDSG